MAFCGIECAADMYRVLQTRAKTKDIPLKKTLYHFLVFTRVLSANLECILPVTVVENARIELFV